jgi:hypothetical protein
MKKVLNFILIVNIIFIILSCSKRTNNIIENIDENNKIEDINLINTIDKTISKDYNIFELIEFGVSVEDVKNILIANNKNIIYDRFDKQWDGHHIVIDGEYNGKPSQIFYTFYKNQFVRGGYSFFRDSRLDENLIGYNNFDDNYLKYNIYTVDELIKIKNGFINEFIIEFNKEPDKIVINDDNEVIYCSWELNNNIIAIIDLNNIDVLLIEYDDKHFLYLVENTTLFQP